jgi:hypothetical protein
MDYRFRELFTIRMAILINVIQNIINENLQHIGIFPKHEQQSLQFFRGFRSKLLPNIPLQYFFGDLLGLRFWLLFLFAFDKIVQVEISTKSLKFVIVV